MDAIETETQTEPRMGGIGKDMRGVGAETETQSSEDELSARCEDRVLEMRGGTRSGSGSGRKSVSVRGRRGKGRGRGSGIGKAGE